MKFHDIRKQLLCPKSVSWSRISEINESFLNKIIFNHRKLAGDYDHIILISESSLSKCHSKVVLVMKANEL